MTPRTPKKKATPDVQSAERKQLLTLLDGLAPAVEDLLLSGLTAASKSTVEGLDIAFKEASRLRLLRLGSTLRIANEEVTRFTAGATQGSAPGATQFSPRRLAFFLGRAWVLARAMRYAIEAGDDAGLAALLATPASIPIEQVKLVTLGVSKRVVPGAFAGFDFRLRAIAPAGKGESAIREGEPLVWSCIFPLRKDLELPAEAFLHLPQKQKFKPSLFLERKVVTVSKAGLSRQGEGAARLTFGEATTVAAGEAFEAWAPLWRWDPAAAAARLAAHRPTPLDLEIDLQEEAFVDSWRAGQMIVTEDQPDRLPIETGSLPFEARIERGPSGSPLRERLVKAGTQKKPLPLFGLLHYESCRLVLQPLALLGKDGPEYMTLAQDKITQAELVKAMRFT